MSDSSDEVCYLTPEELKNNVKNAELSFLPEKSREKYLKTYDIFKQWRLTKGANTFSETVLLSYFIELSQTRQPSTMWSIYSMLKATIKTKDDVHIDTYPKLIAFLKRMSVGHKSKKSKIFSPANIKKFLNEAPDCNFLAAKVILIIGINGACRTNELLNLTVNAIEKHSDKLLLINLPNTKTNIDRSFVIRDEHVNIVERYRALRPANTKTDRFLLQYHNDKCSRQPMGVNKIGGTPRAIATFLKLQEPQLYTGHCFRRTSATLLADSGADLTTIKRHGGWRSNTVAEGYIEDSIQNKSETCKRIVETISLKQTSDPWSRPSTSRVINTAPESPTFTIFPSQSTSKEVETISLEQTSDPWAHPSTTRVTNSAAESPTFTVLPSHSTTMEAETSANTQTQVANTTISVPNKTVTFNLQNCNNFTFNF